jgi:acetyl-CoA carboxylase biotin carboxylase subunit
LIFRSSVMFKKILVANRGEIAVRVMRTCRELGIPCVAVFSDVDRAALHVLKADEAYPIGAAAATESYLNIPKILEVARRSGADALHPGYGFLSENAQFARACAESRVKFIGPSAAAMEMMGSKTRARQAMEKAGVPVVPGTSRGLESLRQAQETAAQIGYPVMVKAAAGGGGKGLRLVRDQSDLQPALEMVRSEAQRAFGDDEVYLEKAILNPRHIEMQVLADEHGNIVYLGERECSVQRRHQKVLEEAPSPLLNANLRRRMGEVAVQVAKAAEYCNAGTVEFLVDSDEKFYFLEMNTRLQVEHPVTELITGLDLVALQIRIAAGERLRFRQEDVSLRGHAIESRIYAEDPERNYFPSPGRIERLALPAGPGIRLDSGVYEGWTVPIEYDPLLGKLIAYGQDRPQAVARLIRALEEFFVAGIRTNVGLFRRILLDEDFQAGRIDTGFLDRLPASEDLTEEKRIASVATIGAAVFAVLDSKAKAAGTTPTNNGAGAGNGVSSSWKKAGRVEGLM